MDQGERLTPFKRFSLAFVILSGALQISPLIVGFVNGLRTEYIIRTRTKIDARIVKVEIQGSTVSGLITFEKPNSPEKTVCSVYTWLGPKSHYLQLKEGQSLKIVPVEGCAAPISIYADRMYIVIIPFLVFIGYYFIGFAKACVRGKW